MNENKCKGCKSYRPYAVRGTCSTGLSQKLLNGECPCVKCLVKVMCIQVCDPFKEYVELVSKTLQKVNKTMDGEMR